MRIVLLAMAAVLIGFAAHAANGFGDSDYAYLQQHWGLKRDGTVLRNLTDQEKATLHSLIDDPMFRDRPQTIESQVGEFLFKIETCFDHPDSEPCPNAPGRNEPGKQIAYRSCISCHLVGSANTPSFYAMTKSGSWTARRLNAALQAGHQMSPIELSDQELRDLTAYINAQK